MVGFVELIALKMSNDADDDGMVESCDLQQLCAHGKWKTNSIEKSKSNNKKRNLCALQFIRREYG